MAIVEPGKGRAILEQNGAGLLITIPAAVQAFGTIFLAIWLIGWAVGEIMVSRQLLSGELSHDPSGGGALFSIVWLAGWTLGGGWALYCLLWQLAGKEIIELTSTTLRQRKQTPLFSRSREYAIANMSNLRVAPPQPQYYQGKYIISGPGFKGGAISFDYGRDTYHLASGLDEADAKYVIGEMEKRVKSLSLSRGQNGS